MKNIIIAGMLVVAALIPSCSVKKDLIIGEWVMDWYFVNGEGQDKNTTIKWTFSGDGSFRQLIENPYGREEVKGKWTLDEKENVLKMFYNSTQTEVLWQIVKLEKDFMELNYTIPGFFVERGFKKQR